SHRHGFKLGQSGGRSRRIAAVESYAPGHSAARIRTNHVLGSSKAIGLGERGSFARRAVATDGGKARAYIFSIEMNLYVSSRSWNSDAYRSILRGHIRDLDLNL